MKLKLLWIYFILCSLLIMYLFNYVSYLMLHWKDIPIFLKYQGPWLSSSVIHLPNCTYVVMHCRSISILDEIIEKLVIIVFSHWNWQLLQLHLGRQWVTALHWYFFPLYFQIEEGTVLYVAGGLIIEHPLILPFVKQVVSLLIFEYPLKEIQNCK